MLASDINNPEFVGATNPDNRLTVKFYEKAVPNEFESNKQGRPIFQTCDFVTIFIPGDALSVIDTPAREDHKQRFPMQWARYQNNKNSDTQIMGTPIEQWPLLNKAQVEELRAIKFYSVDSIANASDLQLQKVGMLAGMSPFSFRERAQRFLQLANGDAEANKSAEELQKVRDENAELRKKQDELTAKMDQLLAQMTPKAGRPRKTEEAT